MTGIKTKSAVIGSFAGTLSVLLSILLLSCGACAQKEEPLPKDLPPFGPEKPVRTPDVKAAKLDNGLSLWLVSEPGFPKIAVPITVRGGLAADP